MCVCVCVCVTDRQQGKDRCREREKKETGRGGRERQGEREERGSKMLIIFYGNFCHNEEEYVRTSLCGVRPNAEHSLGCIEEVSGMIESVKAHYVSTCHRLIDREKERERDKERDKESGIEKVNGQRYGEMKKERAGERQIKSNSCIG